MTDMPAKAPAPPRAIQRHSLLVRVTHWTNALALLVLLMSGLNIFNAHPALYFGKQSHFDAPVLSMKAEQQADGHWAGVTRIGDSAFITTGVFGMSKGLRSGVQEDVGFPGWMTLPSWRDLATARHWHFFFAWVFGLNVLAYWSSAAISGHLKSDLWTRLVEFRTIPAEVWHHLQLKFPEGEAARRYNVLQKLSYFGVMFVILPLMILTGLSMSPGMNAATHGILPAIFGGRQSARSLHFLFAGLIVAFFLVHIVMVLLSGVWNNLRSMITGRYVLPKERDTQESHR